MKSWVYFTALLIVAIVWFAGCQVQQKTFVPPKGYIYARAFGEGATKEEAVKKAKEEALVELARNILVEVKSDVSRRVEIVKFASSEAAEALESVFKRGIDIKSEMELIEVNWKIAEIKKVEDNYVATVYAMVDEAFARLALGTYIAMKIGEALLNSHQIFTAGALFESYKEFLEAALLQLPPGLSSKLTRLVGKIKENWLVAKEKATVIENAPVTSEVEALKLLESY
ncbi:MAG: LPP20 family lipoprotein, partial [Thermotogae bacterium]|nr:LPP20 family lipoprotein [Thermotogota bacterium]